MIIYLIGTTVLIGIILGATPYMSQYHVPFGVTLTGHDARGETVRKWKKAHFLYHMSLAAFLSLLLWLVQGKATEEQLGIIYTGVVFFQFMLSFIFYIHFYNQSKKLKEKALITTKPEQRIGIDLAFRQEPFTFSTSYLVTINVLLALITAGVTLLNYERIPEVIVTQWDMSMTPTTMTDKNYMSVLAIPVMQLFIGIIMGVSNYSIQQAKQRVDARKAPESAKRDKRFRKQSSLMLVAISIGTQLLLMGTQSASMQAFISPEALMVLSLLFFVFVIGLVLWLGLRYGQGGSNIDIEALAQEEGFPSYDDDQYWKLGMFYYNKEDPAFWVEKKMGLGVTFNMAKWQGWAFLVGVILIPLVIVYLMI